MNKHHRSTLKLIFIVITTLILSKHWLDLEFGYGIIFLITAVGYTIYLNFKASRKEQREE